MVTLDPTLAARIPEIVGDDWIKEGALKTTGYRCLVLSPVSEDVFGWWHPAYGFLYRLPCHVPGLPDYTDDATWGVLLGLLPDGWQILRDVESAGWWFVQDRNGHFIDGRWGTKIHALIAALEASRGTD